VRLYEGAYWNLKVTSPDDLIVAEALLRDRFEQQT
jgi:2-C-methyl-D-erythritol 4-phosphate cytidylyltransferase